MYKQEMTAEIVIIGGSLGGCAAALAACKSGASVIESGASVIVTEETKWIGGQLTNQAVPPDEHGWIHGWIEQFGCTRSYREFRARVRQYYHQHFPLNEHARKAPFFNPGNAIVSQISHEPRVALAVLRDMLAPYIHSGKLKILEETKIKAVETDGDTVMAIEVKQLQTNIQFVLAAPYFLDATDMGDVLPLAKIEYVTGAG